MGISAVGVRGRHSWRGWSGESSTSCIENFCEDYWGVSAVGLRGRLCV